jgi:DNA-binding MarR family transcriptional regulator
MPADTKSVQTLQDQIHWLSAEFKRRAAASPEEGKLLLATRGVLQTLAENGDSSVPAIADARNTTRQNIQIIANRLAERSFVEFIPNPRHMKSDLLHLTEKGSALLASATAQEATFVEHLAIHLRKSEVDEAIHCLTHLRAILGSPIPAPRAAPVATPTNTAKRPTRALPSPQIPSPTSAPSMPEPAIPVAKPHMEEESLPVNLL